MVKLRSRAGFTLAEALVTVAIVGILSGMGAGIMLQMNRFFIMSRVRLDLQREARSVMYIVTRALRQAQINTIVIDRQAASQPFYSRITFQKVQGDSLTFRQNGSNLELVADGQTQTLSKNLRYLAFTFPRSDDMGIISVSMTLQGTIYQGQVKALHMASEKVQVMNE